MKTHLYTLVITFFISTLSTTCLHAQFWNPFLPLLEQWDLEELDSIGRETQRLQNIFDFKDLGLRDANDDFQTNLTGANPTESLDSLLHFLQDERDDMGASLEDLNEFERFDLSELDIDESINQFNTINTIWDANLDSLGGVLDLYRQDLLFDSEEIQEGFSKLEDSSGEWEEGFNDPLMGTVMDVHERYALGDKHGSNMERILDSLFHYTTDMELAFGTSIGDRQFHWLSFPVDARAFRLASVPKYNKAWEIRWSLSAAYFDDGGQHDNPEIVNPNKDFKPLMYGADFAFVYSPLICCNGDGDGDGFAVRLYSSLGMELGAYAPSYVLSDVERTFNNVGHTTGFGPQIGAGLVVDAGFLTFYSYGNMVHGGVHNSPGYRYNNTNANVGVRLGDIVNIMYSKGYANWGGVDEHGQNSKFINYDRFTVGLILTELFRTHPKKFFGRMDSSSRNRNSAYGNYSSRSKLPANARRLGF